ncbi:MAG: four-helix bundle copper-binding protein [Pseudomonas sp.]|uniref:four-helix bundle copper-binding protein n=1 Tax=Pseudomonas sp. TaxID=306 RepID=UPI0033933789
MNNTQRYLPVIEACTASAVACETCANACLKTAAGSDRDICIALYHDCIDLCRLAVRLMQRQSALVDEICRLCAITCQAVAQQCNKYADLHCQECAQVCQRCVEQCEEITAGA